MVSQLYQAALVVEPTDASEVAKQTLLICDVADSDDPPAHAAVVRRILTPFSAPSGGMRIRHEIAIKRPWIRTLVDAAANPLTRRDLVIIYDAFSPLGTNRNLRKVLVTRREASLENPTGNAEIDSLAATALLDLNLLFSEVTVALARSPHVGLRRLVHGFFQQQRGWQERQLVLLDLIVSKQASRRQLHMYLRDVLRGSFDTVEVELRAHLVAPAGDYGAYDRAVTLLVEAALEISDHEHARELVHRVPVSLELEQNERLLNWLGKAPVGGAAAWQLVNGLSVESDVKTLQSLFLKLVRSVLSVPTQRRFEEGSRCDSADTLLAARRLLGRRPEILESLGADDIAALTRVMDDYVGDQAASQTSDDADEVCDLLTELRRAWQKDSAPPRLKSAWLGALTQGCRVRPS